MSARAPQLPGCGCPGRTGALSTGSFSLKKAFMSCNITHIALVHRISF